MLTRLRGVWSEPFAVLGLGCLWGGVHPEMGSPGYGGVGAFLCGWGDLVEQHAGVSMERNDSPEIRFSSSPVPPATTQAQPHCPYDTLEGVASRGPPALGHAAGNVRPASWYPGSPVLTEALMNAHIRGQQSPTSQSVFSPCRHGKGRRGWGELREWF